MAKKLMARMLGAVFGGVLGFIIGTLLTGTSIFPTLAWDKILLFVGLLFGAFFEEINDIFEDFTASKK